MKKILFLGASFASLISLSEANTSCHSLYIGAGAAAIVAHNDAHATGIDRNLGTNPYNRSYSFGKTAGGLDIILGYRGHIGQLVWGLEVDYIFSSLNKENHWLEPGTNASTRSRVDSKSGAWGGALILGFHCHQTTPYIRLGFEQRHFKVSYNATNYGHFLSHVGFSKTAFAPGVGIELKLHNNWILGLEYRYAWYGHSKKSASLTPTGAGLAGPVSLHFSVKPHVSTAIVNLKYMFNL